MDADKGCAHSTALHKDGVVASGTKDTHASARSCQFRLSLSKHTKYLGINVVASQHAVVLGRIPKRLSRLGRVRDVFSSRAKEVREGRGRLCAETRAGNRAICSNQRVNITSHTHNPYTRHPK